jgi:hypothetical protein
VHAAPARPPSRAEAALAVLLAALAVIAAAAALPVVWTRLTVLDRDRFAHIVAPLGDDPLVQESLAGLVADDAVQALSAALEANGITENAARLVIRTGVKSVLGGPAFTSFWDTETGDVHDQVLRAVRGEGSARVAFSYVPLVVVTLDDAGDAINGVLDGTVSIPDVPADASPPRVRRLLERGLGVDLPDDFGTLVIYEGGRLDTVGDAVGWVDRLAILLPALAVVLAVAATLVARRRARTLAAIAVAVAAIAGFEALTSQVARDVALTGTSGPGRTLAASIVDALRSDYVGFLLSAAVGALVIAAAAAVAGAAARARTRRSA